MTAKGNQSENKRWKLRYKDANNVADSVWNVLVLIRGKTGVRDWADG